MEKGVTNDGTIVPSFLAGQNGAGRKSVTKGMNNYLRRGGRQGAEIEIEKGDRDC
jgi:hypothetical protein